MKKIFLLTLALVLVMGLMAACQDNGKETTQAPSVSTPAYEGSYSIRLTAIGSTTIKAGKTVQLRSSVTGGAASKDVTFESSDPSVATVSDKGLVTGISAGKVTITCTLVIEPACKQTIEITVEEAVKPTSLTIQNADSTDAWTEETLQLSVLITPEEASGLVTWESSDPEVATVSDNGLVSFLIPGQVTITATSQEDPSMSDSVTFTVKGGFFRSDLGSPYWDVTQQSEGENSQVKLNIDSTMLGYHSCYLADVLDTRYYVEGTFRVDAQISTWVWQGFGFGSGLSESSTRYFIFSPRVDGQGNDFNKFIVKDLPNETWPAITTRSQTWGENGLDNIDWQNQTVKIGMMRDENTYYYFINDQLMYVDDCTVYDGIPTMPILVSVDLPVTVTDYSVITDEAELDRMLADESFGTKFYASNTDLIEILDSQSFVFKTNTILGKLNRVKSLGDAAKLVGNFSVEFDVSDLLYNNSKDCFTGMTLNLSRYDNADTVETFGIGKSSAQADATGLIARYASWNYVLEMSDPNSNYYWLESSKTQVEDPSATHHIKLTRTIVNNIATFQMWVDGEEVDFDVKSSKYNDMTSKYTGAYLLWFGGEYASGQITNLQIQTNI